ncbi:MAG: CmcI family methyltransferase [Gemmatimonadaceae bacterium]|nr:CmcI family methyltransferase [Gemmatimonadaceae bacterium]
MSRQSLFTRALNYLRPAPVWKPLSVTQILADQRALGIVEQFRDLYYRSGVSGDLRWRGARLIKNPCDLWMTLELFQRIRPRVVVETGTHEGGSALFYADLARVLGITTTVITVDPNPKWSVDPEAAGIVSIRGYSTDPKIIQRVREEVSRLKSDGAVMVFLDSEHSADNVFAELETYAPLVTRGSYLIVEDTNVNGHPSFPEHGPGPWEAVDRFLATSPPFEPDPDCERFLLTFNPRGWLRRTG